mmetsp:Transcript_56031/g.128645  ORF Transcript_56031/g.128645 Transcript_56031/m.128645 type:complete len:269 (-) Transcript_56031:405-1211(-)
MYSFHLYACAISAQRRSWVRLKDGRVGGKGHGEILRRVGSEEVVHVQAEAAGRERVAAVGQRPRERVGVWQVRRGGVRREWRVGGGQIDRALYLLLARVGEGCRVGSARLLVHPARRWSLADHRLQPRSGAEELLRVLRPQHRQQSVEPLLRLLQPRQTTLRHREIDQLGKRRLRVCPKQIVDLGRLQVGRSPGRLLDGPSTWPSNAWHRRDAPGEGRGQLAVDECVCDILTTPERRVPMVLDGVVSAAVQIFCYICPFVAKFLMQFK